MENKYDLYKKALIFSKAPHQEEYISKKDALRLISNNNAFLLRNIYNFDCNSPTSFWFVIKDSFADLEELKSKTRNQIRRALKMLDISIIDKSMMLEQGYNVYREAYKRYSNVSNKILSHTLFNKIIKEDNTCQYWGCIDKEKGKLIAYATIIVKDNMAEYSSMKAVPSYLTGYYPFYGLIYKMNKFYLEECKLKYVSDGARSISEHSNIQSFLIEKFAFRKAYCNISITYVKWLELFIMIIFPFRKLIINKKLKSLFNLEAMARGVN